MERHETLDDIIFQVNSLTLAIKKRSVLMSGRYKHPILQEAKSRGWRWNAEHKAFASGKKGEREWAEKTLQELEENTKKAREEKETAIYLNIKFHEKEIAKKHGAKWDRERKKWYATTEAVVVAIEKEIDPIREREYQEHLKKKQAEEKESKSRLASDKQIAVIARARQDWFDIFDGSGRYGVHGPSDSQLDTMTASEASNLISFILANRH